MPGPSTGANLAEQLRQWTAWFGWDRRPAFLCDDDSYTHGEVHRGAARMAGLLSLRGVAPGDRVVIALPGSIEFVWALLGAVRIGAIGMLADPEASILPPGELAVCEAGRHKNVFTPAEIRAELPRAQPAPPHPVLPETPAYVQYGAMYGHADAERYYLASRDLGVLENDVLLSVPKAHDPIGLGNIVFFPLLSGASSVLDPGRRSIAGIAERVRRHRASVLLSTPAFFQRLAAEGPTGAFAPLRVAVSQGAPPPPRSEDWLGCPIVTN